MTRFSKIFQLLTVTLVIAVVNVYVMGAPMKTGTDLKKDSAAAAKDLAPVTVTPAVGAEKLALAPGAKINFNRLFSKSEIKSRAMTSHSFLNATVARRDVFKAPARTGAAPDDTDTNDDGGSKSTWIAVGVIAAVVAVAVIGLRHDRGPGRGNAP